MVIFITGGTSGIGKAIAELLYEEGHRIFVAGRRVEDKFSETAISFLKMDVTNDESVAQGINKLIEQTGRIDVLIQCAGQGAIGPIEEFPCENVAEVFNLNLLGILRVNQAVIPFMRKQNSGKIIQISSLAAEAGLPFQGIYCASKAALDIFNESMRMEIRPFGIQSCVIQPGDFKTDVSLHRKIPAPAKNSPYKQHMEDIVNTATEKVQTAADPVKVARKVSKIVKKSNLKPKYRVGSFTELIMPKVKQIVPAKWFERMLLRYYKL